jgi:deoxyribodipyrimidine photo-lyase
MKQLKRFTTVAHDYRTARDRPDLRGTSSLSPHLHFGEIGPRQLFAELKLASPSGAGAESLSTYASELGWREFAHHLLFHFPHTMDEPLDARFARLRWSKSRKDLHAWQRGRTGIPIVDAGMRELWHTGWMHNRVRMIVASFLTKNLQLHWREGARWFWDTLVDADAANNTMGWQWVAGCGADAAPYYRIFNPVLQAEKFDPERKYLRQWLPELASLPDKWIHQPWTAPASELARANVKLGVTYPKPIVDLKQSRMIALGAYEQMRQLAEQ